MVSPNPLPDVLEAERFEGRIIIRRFTDQLTGADELERSTKAAQAEIDEEEETEEQRRLKLLYEDPANSSTSPQDFDVAEIARVALQEMVDKFIGDAKPSALQRIRIPNKSAKTKTIEVLEGLVQRDFNELKASVDSLEEKWKENHGPIYNAFKKLCGTLDDHKSIFTIFPSQSNYTSVLCASLSCLVKAARNHGDIAETLSKSIASISDKVTTCSNLIIIIKTQRLRKKLANIYARMFQFYKDAIEWYLQCRLSRLFRSFNENLKKGFDDATKDLGECINELYREAYIGSTAMIAMLHGEVSSLKTEVHRQRRNYAAQDTLAGHRMVILLEASWMDSKSHKRTLEAEKPSHLAIKPASCIQDVTAAGITRAQARAHGPALKPFIIGDEGPGLFGAGHFWLAEEEVLPKLQAWMIENAAPRTLWVSSPSDPAGMTSARAAALAVVAAAWQAETPLISHFCQRQWDKVRAGMSIEQVGLVGLVYSLIYQLLEFSGVEDRLDVSKESLAALNGGKESWSASLEVLRSLLDRTPVLMYCVIDGLNDLEWGNGGEWCWQFLDALLARQRRAGTVFNILLTTVGQSRVLPLCVQLKDRHITTKGAREVARVGRRIELKPVEQEGPVRERSRGRSEGIGGLG